LLFDEDGHETDTELNAFALKHIVATIEDWAYLTFFDQEREEAVIVKARLADVNGLAASFAERAGR
jgi:chorismate mutase